MKPVRWLAHALDILADREIDRVEVEQALVAPEFVVVTPIRLPRSADI